MVIIGGRNGDSLVTSSAGDVIVRAPGGNKFGTTDEQISLLTGSIVWIGGHGCPDFTGYSNYNGSGGGSGATPDGNGKPGQSAEFSTKEVGALGGNDGGAGAGGRGAFYASAAHLHQGVFAATDGAIPGGGGGGSYDYGNPSPGAGARGHVIITVS